ncbi:MAG: hypothetical protein JNM27_21085 [Leptospirales bacterium]|nr:hypothetical protein [Leptospirales bacterium]
MQPSTNVIPPTQKILHIAMVMAPAIFLPIAHFLGSRDLLDPTIAYAAVGVGCVAAAASFFVLNLVYRGRSNSFQENLSPYLTAKLIQWAILEGSALFNGVAYFLSGFEYSLGLALGLLLLTAYWRPRESEVMSRS